MIDCLLTIKRTGGGFVIGSVLAFGVGFFINRHSWFRALIIFPIDFLRSLPSIALLPLLLIFVDPSGPIIEVLVTIPVFLVMTLSVVNGLDNTSRLRKIVGKKLELKDKTIFFKIELREALPELVNGMRICISIALVLTIIGEMLFPSKDGIGALIYKQSQNVNDSSDLWASIVALGCLGFGLNQVFVWLDNRYCFWKGR
jgi:ABC-type nitrate/sulfonate/bicarbonate transport system permease component